MADMSITIRVRRNTIKSYLTRKVQWDQPKARATLRVAVDIDPGGRQDSRVAWTEDDLSPVRFAYLAWVASYLMSWPYAAGLLWGLGAGKGWTWEAPYQDRP